MTLRAALAVIILAGACWPVHLACAQPVLPQDEPRYDLRYRFPDSTEEYVELALYRTTALGRETVLRGGRQTIMRFDSRMRFGMAARPLATSETVPAGAMDVSAVLDELHFEQRAGRSVLTLRIDGDGLLEDRPGAPPAHYGPNDRYHGALTFASLVARPGSLRFNNGAMLEPPMSPPLVAATECQWTFEALPLLMPPLPPRPVRVGTTWQAGIPLRLSIFAAPQVVRFDMRLESFDIDPQVANIRWTADAASARLTPAPGIHHIGPDAFARATLRGRMRMHVPTGTILHSEATVEASITHVQSSDTTVQFTMRYLLEPATDEDPDRTADAQPKSGG